MGGFTVSHNSFSGLFFFFLLSVFPWHNCFQQQTNILKQNTLPSNKIFHRNQIRQHSSERDLQGIPKQEFWNLGLTRQLFLFPISLSLLLSPGGSLAVLFNLQNFGEHHLKSTSWGSVIVDASAPINLTSLSCVIELFPAIGQVDVYT